MSKIYVDVDNNGKVTMTVKEANIKFRGWFCNFSGRTDGVYHYNNVDRETGEGYKYFTIKLPYEFTNESDGSTMTVNDLAALGIPVKKNPGNQEKGYDDEYTLKIMVVFRSQPPIIKIGFPDGEKDYGKEDVHRLDTMAYEPPIISLGFGRINPDTGRRKAFLNEFYTKAIVSRASLMWKEEHDDDISDDIPFDMDDDE